MADAAAGERRCEGGGQLGLGGVGVGVPEEAEDEGGELVDGWLVEEDLPHLQADRDKLRQVLQNLIGNAIKFTRDEGEVSVSAALAVSESGEARVLLSVSDNGIGIPSHLHDKVFDAFYQVDSSSTRQHEGSGLGLLLVRRYINAHGGKVWIEDHPTGGTTFRISLPSS